MPQRTFEAGAEPVLPEGFWPDEPIDTGPERTELEQLMADAAVILERIGGVFTIVAVRQKIGPDLYVPIGYRAKWESFAPAIRDDQPVSPLQEGPAPQPDPEPDPDTIGPDPEAPEPSQESEADILVEDDEDDFGPDAEAALAAATEQG